jgi:type I restriction enzyme S subunit
VTVKMELPDAFWFQEGPGVRNWQFTNSGIKLLNVANIKKDGEIDLNKTARCLSEIEVRNKYTHFLVDAGDLVIASSGISFDVDGLLRTRGAFVEKRHLPLCMNTSTIRFKPKTGLSDLNYLKFWLDSIEFRSQITRLVTGSAQQNFGPSHLKSIYITLPSLEKQSCIARRLDEVDHLRRSRRYAVELTDAFLPAVFLEFFGDPVQNPRGWPVVLVEEAGAVQLGRQRAPKYQTGQFRKPYVRVANVYENEIDLSDLLYMDFNASDYATYALKYGDILLNEGQSTELVGRPAMWRDEIPDCCFQNTLLRFQADQRVCEPAYALWLFISYLHTGEFAKLSAKTSSVAHLGSYRLSQMRFPLPPLPLQRKFAVMVKRVERLRAVQREALRQAEHLFATLLHRTFN